MCGSASESTRACNSASAISGFSSVFGSDLAMESGRSYEGRGLVADAWRCLKQLLESALRLNARDRGTQLRQTRTGPRGGRKHDREGCGSPGDICADAFNTFGDRRGLQLVGFREHHRVAHCGVVELFQHLVVSVFKSMAAVHEHENPGKIRPAR